MTPEIEIREVNAIGDFQACIELQREAFNLPDLEISPLRHFVVSHNAGGFTLGAFVEGRLVGFVHHLVALKDMDVIGYSHMTAIVKEFQNAGIGAKLKWAQREKALSLGQKFIKWTFDPMQSRNANFNLNKLGAMVRVYAENYYGTDYLTMPLETEETTGLDSDRLFGEWELDSAQVNALANGETPQGLGKPLKSIEIPANWREVVERDIKEARAEQLRVRHEFQNAFAEGLVCAGFERGAETSRYLFYKEN